MDVLQDIKSDVHDTKEIEEKSKIILELSEKKYDLQKKLRNDTVKLSEQKSSLTELRTEVVKLAQSFMTLQVKEKVALEMVQELTRSVAIQEKETEKLQAIYWKKINDFVSKSIQHLKKHPPDVKNPANHDGGGDTATNKQNIRQIELQGRAEAMKAFEKYQNRKIEELVLMKKMMDI